MKKLLFVTFVSSLITLGVSGCGSDDNGIGMFINDVPADQDNTEGKKCDARFFVEHCDGNTLVYCDVFEEVAKKRCDTNEKCALTTDDKGMNRAVCVSEKIKCHQGDKNINECGIDPDFYEVNNVLSCSLFNDNNYYYRVVDYSYCSGLCSDGCKQVECNSSEDDYCSEDGDVTMRCTTMPDEKKIFLSKKCSRYVNQTPKACMLDIETHKAFCE